MTDDSKPRIIAPVHKLNTKSDHCMLAHSSPKSVSLIVTTYNWKEALTVVLNSVNQQSRLPDEVIIADDGSRTDTKQRIDELKKNLKYKIRHIRHPDDGFQVSKIRNRAIAASNSEYVVSIDGDMMLHKRFISDHLEHAKPGNFIQGGRVIMNEFLTKSILDGTQGIPDIGFLSPNIKNRKNALWHRALTSYFIKFPTNNLKRVRGCNQAFWKSDLIKINGFNEAFHGWGREDSDICLRLNNAGVDRVNLKFGGIAYHLYHPEAKRTSLSTNDDILATAIKEKLVFCEKGLNQYIIN